MEHQSNEVEVKCIQSSFRQFPQELLVAMLQGREHPRIPQWDFIDQSYIVPDDPKMLRDIVKTLNDLGITFGEREEQEALAQVGEAQELRILDKHRLGIHQLTIKGKPQSDGYLTPQLETLEADSRVVGEVIQFLKLRRRVTGRVQKLWHDIVEKIDGQKTVVEHDILLSHDNLMVVETEVERPKAESAVMVIQRLVRERLLPPYFGPNVTGRPELKSRTLAFTKPNDLPEDIRTLMERRSDQTQFLLGRIIAARHEQK